LALKKENKGPEEFNRQAHDPYEIAYDLYAISRKTEKKNREGNKFGLYLRVNYIMAP
jgi:hypothetical protein